MIKIGSKLLEARTKRGLSLDEVSQATKIRKEFLSAIEKGNYASLPSSAYAYGFVRNYANFLDIDENFAIALFKREFDSDKTFSVLPQAGTKSKDIKSNKIRLGRSFLLGIPVLI